MTTKEQERKALDQIRKIVDGLGKNSYIGTAFEGCFEIAEENIDNDFGCSMKGRADASEAEAKKWMLATETLKKELTQVKEALVKETDRANLYEGKYEKSYEAEVKNWNEFCERDHKVAELENEIIHLKAKLYDLICKGTV